MWPLQHGWAMLILEDMLCTEHREHQPFQSTRKCSHHPVSGPDGFSVVGVRGRGHPALGDTILSWKFLS